MPETKKFVLNGTMYGRNPPLKKGSIVELTEAEAKSPLWMNMIAPIPDGQGGEPANKPQGEGQGGELTTSTGGAPEKPLTKKELIDAIEALGFEVDKKLNVEELTELFAEAKRQKAEADAGKQ